MKRLSLIASLLTLLTVPFLFATNVAAQAGSPPGVYENFTVGKESGDLVGMRVVIFPAAKAFHAMVQIAEGGAEDPKPVFVEVSVRGTTVEFTVNDKKYSGTVSIAGLRIKDADGATHVLKRRPCATLFR
jgi:hypothetical protein